jgi:enoyl-CoA hydratase
LDTTQIAVEREAARATVILDRPEALNAITPTMLEELDAVLTALEDDEEVRVVVLTGRGRAFSAGVDLKVLQGMGLADGEVGGLLNGPARRVTDRLSQMPKPVIAAINGFCFTGALELALACDLIVVAEEAKLGDTHAKWGLRPTWGMSQRLPLLVGPARARELSYTARTFTGAEAVAYGLAVAAAPASELSTLVDELADSLAANSPGSIAAYKDLYRAADRLDLPTGLAYEYGTDYRITDSGERLSGFG